MIPVKASSITNLTDARYFAAWQCDWLGFNLQMGSPDYISPTSFEAMRSWVAGTEFVGEFGIEDVDTIAEMAKLLQLDAIQLGHFHDKAAAEALQAHTLFKEVIITPELKSYELLPLLDSFAPFVNHFILDFTKTNWAWFSMPDELKQAVKEACKAHSIFIQFNFDTQILDEMFVDWAPEGLVLRGGDEERVGYKSFDDLDEIFEKIEEIEEL